MTPITITPSWKLDRVGHHRRVYPDGDPFTPARKDNNEMFAWMAARCDEPNYGKVLGL